MRYSPTNFRTRPANPYPMKFVDKAIKIWYPKLLAYSVIFLVLVLAVVMVTEVVFKGSLFVVYYWLVPRNPSSLDFIDSRWLKY